MEFEFDALTYYENLYYKEIEFSDRLNQKCGNSIALLTVIGSGQALNASELLPIKCPLTNWDIIVTSLWVISILCFVDALFAFKSAYSGYKYMYFPIQGMSLTIDVAEKRGMGEEENKVIRDRLINLYKDAAINNRKSNLEKSQAHRRLNKAIIFAFVAVAVVFALHRIPF